MRSAILILISILSVSTSGCFLWPHGKSPQQQYTEALMRGNSMEASQVWLNMRPEDKMKFARGEGIRPNDASADDVKQQIMNHYEDQTPGDSSAAEQTEQQVPTPLGASLRDLPAAAGTSSPAN